MRAIFLFLMLASTFAVAENQNKYLQGELLQGPFKTSVVEGAELSFLKTGDVEFPVSLILEKMGKNGKKVRELVGKYEVAGSDPKIESLFFYPIKGKNNVLVLVSWTLTSRGIGTYGTLYQVYGYEKNERNSLVVNNLVTYDDNLSGIDGFQEGEAQSFSYVDAVKIKAYLKNKR
ncbi:hypothetical protein ACW9H6_23730 [Pseudomonas sp. SDO528_S397]